MVNLRGQLWGSQVCQLEDVKLAHPGGGVNFGRPSWSTWGSNLGGQVGQLGGVKLGPSLGELRGSTLGG